MWRMHISCVYVRFTYVYYTNRCSVNENARNVAKGELFINVINLWLRLPLPEMVSYFPGSTFN